MKIKRLLLHTILLMACLASVAGNVSQRFYNLTSDEVRIDSLLPKFACSVPLPGAYADSAYTVSIEYPEFYEMSDDDIARYKKITDTPLPAMPVITTDLVVERKRGHLEIAFVPLAMRGGKPVKLVSFMVSVKAEPLMASAARAKAARAAASDGRYADHSVLATGRWAKIRVPETGIYALTSTLIRRAGFSDPSRVKIYGYGGALQADKLVADDLISTDDLKEVATCTVGGNRLFHAQGPVTWSTNSTLYRTRNQYSDYGYYFLTESDGEPLQVDSAAFVSSFYPSTEDYHSLHEVDNYAWYQGGRNLYENTPVSVGASKSYTIAHSTATPGSRTIYVKVTAGQASSIQVTVNGTEKKTLTMGSFSEYDHAKEASASFQVETELAADTVTISTISGGPARLDYISVYYKTAKAAPTLTGRTFQEPEYVYNITNQDHHADGPADMVIIVPTSGKLTAQAQRIKELHEQRDAMRVRIVPADELYNEFSSGTPDANAYRRYMKMLYDRAETEADMPKYLLLFGDCVWDSRMKSSACSSLSPDDFLLCYESENSFSSTMCYVNEGYFGCLDDGEGASPDRTDKMDIAVGRFPVRTADEAKVMTDKTINYVENKNGGSWQNVMMFMGDDGNNNQLMQDADMIAAVVDEVNPAVQVKRVMWDAYERVSSSTGKTYPEVTRLIKQQQQSGALVMNYSGHAKADQISHENVLRLSDFKAFTNTNLPLWIGATCDIMPFDTQQDNIGEAALLNSKGGAVAFFGTARTVYITQNRHLNEAYMRYLVTPADGRYRSIGEAMREAKNYVLVNQFDNSINKLQYSLMGDPALVLNMPVQRAVIDSINDVSLGAAADKPVLNAGALTTVKGHVNTAGGQIDTAFNGTVNLLVRDAASTVVCRMNEKTADDRPNTPFTFTERNTIIYNGTNTVKDGRFTVTFAVPKDIDYSNSTGLINIFALDSATGDCVNGYNEQFTVGGSSSMDNDSIGPSIYCYLNSPSFVNGGDVNTTPYFVAQITDKDGINAAGSGIGHDMTLTIDGDMNKTYILNENFEYELGSYTQGKTYYNIPELAPGRHTLRFRAWDILNNCSTAELEFNVIKGLTPQYLSIACTENPAKEKTTFIVNHDRAGSDISVEIEVFDISGRPLWKHSENGVSATNAYTVDWNLTTDSGERLKTGVYIYRVKLGCDNSGMASKARKLVVINN